MFKVLRAKKSMQILKTGENTVCERERDRQRERDVNKGC